MSARPVALVTGASRGIGREIAIRLAQAGYDIGLTARSAEDLGHTATRVRRFGARAISAVGDVSRPDDVTRVCDIVETELGPVDALINNAGYLGQYTQFLDADLAIWWRVVETNVRGPALFCHRLLPGMVHRGHGYVININSLQGSRTEPAGSSSYGVSKAALMRLTDILADQTSGTAVIVMDLSPGFVRTEMTADRPDLESLPAEEWTPISAAPAMVVQLISGHYDRLHGRFVHATDDLDDLVKRLDEHPQGRALRLNPAGPGDPDSDHPIATRLEACRRSRSVEHGGVIAGEIRDIACRVSGEVGH